LCPPTLAKAERRNKPSETLLIAGEGSFYLPKHLEKEKRKPFADANHHPLETNAMQKFVARLLYRHPIAFHPTVSRV
jgi:hypothetical protein